MKQRSSKLRRAAIVVAAATMLVGGAAWGQTSSAGVTACVNNSGLLRAAPENGTCKAGEERLRLASQEELDQVMTRVQALESVPGSGSSTPSFSHLVLHRQPSGLGTGPCIQGTPAELPDRGWSNWSSAVRCDETGSNVGVVALNEAMFPDGAQATARYVVREGWADIGADDDAEPVDYGLAICAELYNIDTQTPVPGSQACGRSAVQSGEFAMASSFELPSGVERERLMWRYRAEFEVFQLEYGEGLVDYRLIPAGSIAEVVIEVIG